MKKIIVLLGLIGLVLNINAQENKIDSIGNVGIGRTNPTANLEVYKWNGLAHARIFTNQHAGMAKLEIAGGVAGFDHRYSGWNIYHSYGQTNKDLYFRYGQTGEPDIVFTDNGNLGIGNANPTANLEVYKWDGLAHARIYTNQHAGMAKLEIAGGVAGFDHRYSGWSIYHSYGQTNKDLYFRHGQTGEPNVIFSDNGNVAIYGKLESKEVKVTHTPTADFVFEEDYNLPTLEFIENHIKEKKHLPEIASAEEMKKKGLNIGDFQIKLLQKIEELTLYTITQQKEIERLRSIEKRLEKIEKLIEFKK
ncbi:porin [Aquimarina aquimarini]|uniref:porin n=1 Tax=Aquimarina aquimarini TaxID=1191734 RepID=UPI001F277A5B|nr:porin [Aquimarina aquimarini]